MAIPERETVIVERGGGGAAVILAVVVILAAIGIGYIFLANNNGGASGTLDVDVPAVSVDVVPDGQ
ncbi:hypothetical protein SAMN02983003_0972 [Devosia enhydra]|uniref:Uncharacterized protein n=1 Tax=Devosia enhydra TaxID=665118 RepID=A0A1K2HUN2_9HYPH|nr:hypothetical protein [Devosia enhydra]SFZ82262.1 hypothetical protein SAMN02983003_0972 [Devosia enhydra]